MEPDKGYPWRSSLIKNARCGMCTSFSGIFTCNCNLGHEVVYPLMVKEHNCKVYDHKPHIIESPPEGRIIRFNGNVGGMNSAFPECEECSHNLMGHCGGVQWSPIGKKDGKCEFFRDKNLICRNAIPMFQYGDTIRNNYCKLPPHLRDGDSKQGWKWMCPNAHTEYIKNRKCYNPIKSGESQ